MFSHLLFGIENTMLVWNWVSLSDLGKRDLSGLCGAVTWSVTVLVCYTSQIMNATFVIKSSRLLQHPSCNASLLG